MADRYRSDALASIHETIQALLKVGAVDEQTMREFDAACLAPVEPVSPETIRARYEQQPISLGNPLVIGSTAGLRFVLNWGDDDWNDEGPIGRTWGELQLWVADTLVWGDTTGDGGKPAGIRWSWIDLLEFLAIAWPYLQEEETYPIDFDFATRFTAPEHLGQLRGKAKLRWRDPNLLPEHVETEQEALDDFLLVHDFGEALKGAFPPNLLLLRQGQQMRAATHARPWTLSYVECMSTLQALAQAIVDRLADLDDARSKLALERWQTRDQMDAGSRLEAATGLDQETLDRIWPDPSADVSYTLKAAARMVGTRLDAGALRTLLDELAQIPRGEAPALAQPRRLAAKLLDDQETDEPCLQGYDLAGVLRQALGLADGAVDPATLLASWGVRVSDIALPSQSLDAIAIWGDGHQPTVLINTRGLRSQYPTGRRISLAHEICHLLVDTEHALPAVEVLGGRVPADVEARANAFAAELLLPRARAGQVAAERLRFVNTPDAKRTEIEELLKVLAADYGVSFETAAWQIRNSGVLLRDQDDLLNPYLKSVWQPF
ncbi:ImmA/IrrE family metallo-endopeptidase [Thiohalocapsa sp. ML1]|jgi:Zn-dependent peptidase ImmA (M78 family)|uniref:ImmA/IrrE family metallo-endopeptidase n=1 Tax=Thiohalocapsa sp. ML1 TaxID=1431688 RepID=UPI0007320221|nr:ImmA/IrrE family metallo-endopeptidase [Thiohalocapsa sp. ML1]